MRNFIQDLRYGIRMMAKRPIRRVYPVCMTR